MKKQDRFSAPAVGGASLLVIFGVLCLCLLSILSVSTVLVQKRMAQASAEAAVTYYEADMEAQKIFARLRNGEQVPGVQEDDGLFCFACEVSENQRLEVQLKRNGKDWKVLRWQMVAEAVEAADTLPVWDGT